MIRVSHPPDVKKAYGLVTAVGTKLGERARTKEEVLTALRAVDSADALRAFVRRETEGALAPAVVEQFLAVVTDADWAQWRARIVLQAKMVAKGEKPAPGHEQGRGVGKP